MTRQKTRQLASGYSCLLQVPLRVSYDLLFLLFPLAPASSESYSGPLHNLLPPRCCVCRVKSLIAVSRRKCVIQLAYLHPSIFMRFRIHSSARSIEYILYSSPASCANTILRYSRPLFSFLSFDSNSRYRLKKTNKRRILSIYSEFQNSVLSAGILKSSFLVTLKQFGKILAIHPSVINRCREKVP